MFENSYMNNWIHPSQFTVETLISTKLKSIAIEGEQRVADFFKRPSLFEI